jgi:hypothetical protein
MQKPRAIQHLPRKILVHRWNRKTYFQNQCKTGTRDLTYGINILSEVLYLHNSKNKLGNKLKLKLVLLAAALFITITFSIANASQVEIVQVSPLTQKTLTFNLNNEDKFTGSLSISGGGGNDIDFWVTDPQGTTILNQGRVSQGTTFEFTAQMSGGYTLHFGNTFSLFSSKTVNLSYDVSTPILGGTGFGFLLMIIGIIVIVIVVVGLTVGFGRRKSTSKTNVPLPPSNPQ